MKHFYLRTLLLCMLMISGLEINARYTIWNYHSYTVDGIRYYIDDSTNEATVTWEQYWIEDGDGPGFEYAHWNTNYGKTSVVIPSSITINGKNYTVTEIGEHAFDACGMMTVTLPETIKKVGEYAFRGPTTLATMPSSIESIGDYAFEETRGWENLTLPKNLKTIGDYAFSKSDIVNIDISNSVQSIGDFAFDECKGIMSIRVEEDNPYYDSRNDCNAIIVTNTNTLKIGSNNTIIPEGIVCIDDYAFRYYNKLLSINIPTSLVSIGKSAFYGCYGLEKVIIPDIAAWCSVSFKTSIEDDANMSANPLTYAKHLYSDENTEITDLVIPEGIKKIGPMFCGCRNVKSVSIPNSVEIIGGGAFKNCGLEKIEIPNSVRSIENYAFENCNIKSLTLPNGLNSIGEGAFKNCALETIVIPNSIRSIEPNAFANCMSLYSVTSLINIPFKLNGSVFGYTGYNYDKDIIYMAATLYVPRGRTAMYSNVEGWKKFMNIMETDTKFRLTYMLDGEEYKTYEIQAAEVITPEPDPYKEGYIFSGWSDIPYLMPAQDVTVRGSFTVDPDYQAGVEGVSKDDATPKAYYSVSGRQQSKARRGLNIIRMSDGTVRKVIVRSSTVRTVE